jgi:hypothetical protein
MHFWVPAHMWASNAVGRTPMVVGWLCMSMLACLSLNQKKSTAALHKKLLVTVPTGYITLLAVAISPSLAASTLHGSVAPAAIASVGGLTAGLAGACSLAASLTAAVVVLGGELLDLAVVSRCRHVLIPAHTVPSHLLPCCCLRCRYRRLLRYACRLPHCLLLSRRVCRLPHRDDVHRERAGA